MPSKHPSAGLLARFIVAVAMFCGLSVGPWSRDEEPPSTASVTEPAPPDDITFGLREPRPRTPGAIRIATYNVENLFDHVDDPDLSGEFDDKDLGITPERAKAVADVIRRLDADVIALVEIESLDALRWFRDTYLADMGYEHAAAIDVGYDRGVEQGVLSRFEIVSAKVWPNAPLDDLERPGLGWTPMPRVIDPSEMTIQRSPIMVEIRTPGGYKFTLFAVHHKAGNFAWKRELEALRIVEWYQREEARDPSRNIMVVGDFNAAPWDKSLRVYLEAGLVDVLAHRATRGDESLQHKTHRTDRVLDYILLNSAALREYVVGSAHVVGTCNPPPTWNWRTDPHPPGYAADHYPVVIDMVGRDRK